MSIWILEPPNRNHCMAPFGAAFAMRLSGKNKKNPAKLSAVDARSTAAYNTISEEMNCEPGKHEKGTTAFTQRASAYHGPKQGQR